MSDIINYDVDSLSTTVFDQQRTSVIEEILPADQKPCTSSNNYCDLVSLISRVTSPSDIDYQMLGDFFLTFRSFISPQSLLKILILRLKWCLEQINDYSHERIQNAGKLILLRTFVAIRHWLLNYFTEDFISSTTLRTTFVASVNSLTHQEVFVQRIIANLKKTWTECCNKSWDEKVIPSDFYTFTIKVGPQDSKFKRLSYLALSQQNNPLVRNSTVLSSFDPNRIHRLPVSAEHSRLRTDPRLPLNPKNSNHRLDKASELRQLSDTPLYTSLTTPFASKRNIIRDSTEFPRNPTLSRLLPPTPVKKMELIVPLPPVAKPQQRGFRPLIENWLKTFNKHNETERHKDLYVEKFMRSVVSVSKVDVDNGLDDSVLEKFDILCARTIDELEYLIRFHNEIVSKHGVKLGLNNASESFNFIRSDQKDDSKRNPAVDPLANVSNIDNMNICETISIISKSVISLRQINENDNKSYISYDSLNSRNRGQNLTESNHEGDLKKKKGVQNLREFNFEINTDEPIPKTSNDDNFNNEHDDAGSELSTYPSSIISESTPNEIDMGSADTVNNGDLSADIQVDLEGTKSTIAIKQRESLRSNTSDKSKEVNVQFGNQTQNSSPLKSTIDIKQRESLSSDTSKKPEQADQQLVNDTQDISLHTEVVPTENDDEIPPRSPDRLTAAASKISGETEEQLSAQSTGGTRSPKSEQEESDDIESLISSYDSPVIEELEQAGNTLESSHNLTEGPATPPATASHDGLISSTPNISPIKSISERNAIYDTGLIKPVPQSPQLVGRQIDLNEVPSFSRVSNGSCYTRTSTNEHPENGKVADTPKRSHKITFSETSPNSIFSDFTRTQKIVNVSITHYNIGSPDTSSPSHSIIKHSKPALPQTKSQEDSISLVDTINSDNMAIPYPGVDSEVIAELAGIDNDSTQDDPIAAALLKLEGNYQKRSKTPPNDGYSTDSADLLKKIESLSIPETPNKRNSLFIDRRRKTKLFSLTPVKRKEITQELSSSKILMELLLTRKIENDALMIDNSEQHASFILNFDSKTLAEQFTLIEKDCLLEIDWKELVNLKWDSSTLTPINSWLELLIQNDTIHGIDLCISRFNLTVNWIISEILFTKNITLRKLTIQRFIHIAQNCKSLQNYSTLMQILLALGSDKVIKLKDTWRIVEPGDLLIYKNLESVASPFKNFICLRNEINKLRPSKGCVPFLGLYLSDLIFNKEKKSVVDGKINFAKFKHDSKIVRSLIQCIQWSMLYKIEPNDEVLSKCLYIKSLTEEEMNVCFERIR